MWVPEDIVRPTIHHSNLPFPVHPVPGEMDRRVPQGAEAHHPLRPSHTTIHHHFYPLCWVEMRSEATRTSRETLCCPRPIRTLVGTCPSNGREALNFGPDG